MECSIINTPLGKVKIEGSIKGVSSVAIAHMRFLI